MRESPEHAALVELFRHHPELAATLARQVGKLDLPVGATPRLGDPVEKPSTLVPDVVVELRGERAALAITVEIQRSVDAAKLYTWPAYLWIERARRQCDCVVMVIATRRYVAQWARAPIHGGPSSVTQVMVIGPDDIPRITDPAEAPANPALAVLSASVHARAPDGIRVARAALAGIYTLHPDQTRQYHDLVFRSLSMAAIRQFHEDIMQEQQEIDGEDPERTPWDEYIEPWLERAEAKARGNVLLRLLKLRGMTVDEELRVRVLGCSDTAQLDAWIDRVVTASRLSDVFDD